MQLPSLFQGSAANYVLCLLIMLGGQLIYATVGFGAGMFAVTLLVMLLKDLPGVVMTMLLLTWTTEVLVLSREWRNVWWKLWLVLLPPVVIGLWLGTDVLASGDTGMLRKLLGGVVAIAGGWYLYSELRSRATVIAASSSATDAPRRVTTAIAIAGLPAGLGAGFLGALFGTGAPPLLVLFKSLRIEKRAFRATLLAVFIMKSVVRSGIGIQKGLLTGDHVYAALYLLPGSIVGTVVGAKIYKRLSERVFARIVSVLIILLGLALLVTTED